MEEVHEFLHVRLLVSVWPRVSAPSVLTLVIIMLCQSLQIDDLIPFSPHHPLDVITHLRDEKSEVSRG